MTLINILAEIFILQPLLSMISLTFLCPIKMNRVVYDKKLMLRLHIIYCCSSTFANTNINRDGTQKHYLSC